MDHPLDRPIWHALATRQAALAMGGERARRYRPEINMFAATADFGSDSLAALISLADPPIGIVERVPPAPPPQLRIVSTAMIDQMVADAAPNADPGFAFAELGPDDAAEMLELATLTAPGPFFAETWRMGRFIGVRANGRLAAMAGQRMQVPGFTEVSAVCTHPDHRGQGHAGRLMQVVIDRIVAAGDAAFLHVYPDNRSAIALYETLGFRLRAQLNFQVWSR